jgi:hypothetical protein
MKTTEHQLRALLAETDRDRVSQSPSQIEPAPQESKRTSPVKDQTR